MKGLDGEIDRLYQLPLSEFTAERNALAKRAGADGPTVRTLDKPSVAAWAVNQLYWRDRREWDVLIASAENLRRAHTAVLAGREADVRAAGQVHDQAVESALKATVNLLEELKHPVTDATRQGILNTLRALPAADARPGRLTDALQPGGFEMLAGLAIGGGQSAHSRAQHATMSRSRERARPHETRREHATRDLPPSAVRQPDARAMAAARQEAASADRALREAEQTVRREEFEAARASREERRASEAVDKARDAFERAKQDLQRAEAALEEARDARGAADARVPRAHDAVTAAEKRARTAAAALQKLTARG